MVTCPFYELDEVDAGAAAGAGVLAALLDDPESVLAAVDSELVPDGAGALSPEAAAAGLAEE